MSTHDVVQGIILLLIGCLMMVQSRIALKLEAHRRKALGTGLFGNGLLVAGVSCLMKAKLITVSNAEQNGLQVVSAVLMVSGLVLLIVETIKEQKQEKAKKKQKSNLQA